MQQRITELGVRKAFGGTKSVLVRQILNENLMLTLLGGVVGLLFSYLAVYAMRMWLFTNNQNVGTSGELSLNMEALFSPWVFLLAFAFLCGHQSVECGTACMDSGTAHYCRFFE